MCLVIRARNRFGQAYPILKAGIAERHVPHGGLGFATFGRKMREEKAARCRQLDTMIDWFIQGKLMFSTIFFKKVSFCVSGGGGGVKCHK